MSLLKKAIKLKEIWTAFILAFITTAGQELGGYLIEKITEKREDGTDTETKETKGKRCKCEHPENAEE